MTSFSTVDQSSVVLQQIFTTKKFTDITLKAGKDGKIIHAHKNVLVASLEYFDLMFSGPFKESSDQEVTIDDIEAHILEAVIKFLYLGLVLIPDVKTAVDLWKAAHLMEISALQDHALNYIMDNIDSENCLGLFFLAKLYELDNLSSSTLSFSIRNFETVIKENEFKQLSKDKVVNFINNVKDVTKENELAEGILLWIEFDESRKKLHFQELLRLLEINLIDQQVLIDRLYSNCIDMEDMKYMLDSLHKIVFGNETNLLEPNPEMILLVEALGNNKKALFFYNVRKDAFVGKNFLQIKGSVAGVWQNKIVIIESDSDKQKVITYDLQRKETIIVGIYVVKRCIHYKIITSDLYISSDRFYKKINLQTGESKIVSTVDFLIENFVYFDDRIYFIAFKRTNCDDFWITTYQENDENWSKHQSFSNSITKRYGSVLVHKDCIYFFGESKLTIYNPKEDTCSEGLKYEISGRLPVVSIENKLFVGKDKTISEYIDGKLIRLSSKLNLLDGKSLQLFTLNS